MARHPDQIRPREIAAPLVTQDQLRALQDSGEPSGSEAPALAPLGAHIAIGPDAIVARYTTESLASCSADDAAIRAQFAIASAEQHSPRGEPGTHIVTFTLAK